jgi:hypothetical protein
MILMSSNNVGVNTINQVMQPMSGEKKPNSRDRHPFVLVAILICWDKAITFFVICFNYAKIFYSD